MNIDTANFNSIVADEQGIQLNGLQIKVEGEFNPDTDADSAILEEWLKVISFIKRVK